MTWSLIASAMTFVSTLAGGIAALRWRGRRDLLMALAGGVVLAAAFFDLLPNAIARAAQLRLSANIPLYALVVGYLSFLVGEHLIHRHSDAERSEPDPAGLVGAAGFVVHSFFDGLAIGLGFKVSSALGLLVAAAIIGHDFSDGLNTVSYLVRHHQPASRSRWWLLADALTPLAGAVTASLLPVPGAVFPVALGFFSGLFVYAATTNLLPRARALPVAQGLPVAVAGAAVMFAITRVA